MPRGQRKHYQFHYKVWFGKGGSIEESTTKDLTPEQYAQALREVAQRLIKIAENTETAIELAKVPTP